MTDYQIRKPVSKEVGDFSLTQEEGGNCFSCSYTMPTEDKIIEGVFEKSDIIRRGK